MAKENKAIFLAVVLIITGYIPVSAKTDPYQKLAKELSDASEYLVQPKVAIIPFSYMDQHKSSGGTIVAERLTTRIVKLRKLQVIERQLLEKVLQELHLESSGVIDSNTAKQIGRILGVNAIITGTLLDLDKDMVEVNARIIKTDTAEVVATSLVEVKRIWSDQAQEKTASGSSAHEKAYTYEPSDIQPSGKKPRGSQRTEIGVNGFLEFYMGTNAGVMELTFRNTTYPIDEVDLSLHFDDNGTLDHDEYRRIISFTKLETNASVPLGLRLGMSSKIIGLDIELSQSSYVLARQSGVPTSLDGVSYTFEFWAEDYFKVNTIGLMVDIFFQVDNEYIRPYIGGGYGLSMNRLTSSYIYSYQGNVWMKGLDMTSLGWLFKGLAGVRVMIGKEFSMFGEYRMAVNSSSFDRGIRYERDRVKVSSKQILFGCGLLF